MLNNVIYNGIFFISMDFSWVKKVARNLTPLILNNLMAKIDSLFVSFAFRPLFLEHNPDEKRGLPVLMTQSLLVLCSEDPTRDNLSQHDLNKCLSFR